MMEKPAIQIAATAPVSEIRMVSAGIGTARQERRKAKITAITISTASPIEKPSPRGSAVRYKSCRLR